VSPAFVDTHAHLTDARFAADRDAALARARAAGVVRILEIADEPDAWDRALALCRERPQELRCSLGLHPYHVDRFSEELAEDLVRRAKLPEVAAAGEFGLDYARCPIPPEAQRRVLPKLLEAAGATGLPVVLHCRDAYADLFDILRAVYGGRRPRGRYHGVLHCFSAGAAEAETAVRLGFAIGVDGPVTYPKNDALRGGVRAAGLASVVLETDSPYLPPQSRRGQRNEPQSIPEIADAVAAVFGRTLAEIAAVTTENARELFGFAGI